MDDRWLTGLPDDYYDYGPGSRFDAALTSKEQADVEAIRRAEDAARWGRARAVDADADGM